jgi:phosphate-selective porin OprO/OprP
VTSPPARNALVPVPLLALAIVLLARTAAAQAPDEGEAFQDFHIGSKSAGHRLEFHGRLQNDWAAFSTADDVKTAVGEFENGTELRRAQLAFSGVLYDWLDFKASVDLTDEGSGLIDMWVETAELGDFGRIRIGHFKEPFGLERVASSGVLTFLEPSIASALTPGRNVGVMCSNPFAAKRGTWALGTFYETDASGEGQNSVFGEELGFTGRLTFLPWYGEDGRRLAHVGVSASARDSDDGEARFRSEPEINLASDLVDTGSFAAQDLQLLGLEGGVILGIASLQAEYILGRVDVPLGDDASFPGFSVQASCFLTGESRGYSRTRGHFSAPELLSRFDNSGASLGAWEIAARYSRLDLDSAQVFGGDARNATIGLNWYINEGIKVQLNYVYSELETFGYVQGLAIRFQFEW